MNIVSLRIFVALVGLGVLWVIVPDARSDDATDWANQQAQAQKEREDWQNQQAQAQRDREQAERDQQARDAWQNSALTLWADARAAAACSGSAWASSRAARWY